MKKAKSKVLQEYKTLDEIKEELQEAYQKNNVLYQRDVVDAVEHLDMSDTEFDDLFQWFSDHDIDIVNEDDDTDLMDDDALADEGSDDLDFCM